MQDTRNRSTRQAKSSPLEPPLTDEELRRFTALLAPDPSLFSGDRNRRRPKPNLFVETVSYDEHGEEKIGTKAPRGVDGTPALRTHFRAGFARTPATLPNYDGPPIRAVSLGYEEDDLVGWFDLDLDGGYPIDEIGPVLARVFGKGRLVCHSGSGREGRYRVFGLLSAHLTVRRLNALLSAVATHLGFPPVSKGLEISPAYKHSRLPGGLGGCQMFDIETGRKLGEPDQDRLVRTSMSLPPIDLEAEARKLGVDLSGIDTGIRRSRGRFDPDTRRERPRNRPRHVRALLRRGVTRPGERQKVQHAFFIDKILSGYSLHEAVPKFCDYIDEGKFDASEDVKRHGREWLKKQALRIGRGIYASTRPVGMPDPIPCDGAELHRIRKIAKRVHAEFPEFSERKVEEFLKKILAIFKGCIAAGLPLARIHSKIWQAAGGTHYARLRAACGIFDARSGYKSLKLVLSRAHLGAKPCEAKAIDWSTSFVFDRDLPAPSYEIVRSIFVDTNSTSSPDPIVVVPLTPSPSVLPSRRKASSPRSRLPQGFTRLYVHRLQDPLEMSRSENLPKVSILPPDEPNPILSKVDIDYPTMETRLSDEIHGAKRRRRELKRARSVALYGPVQVPKPPEWQRIAKFTIPCPEDMGIDEWLDLDTSLKDEYKRLLSEAKKDQRHLWRTKGIDAPLRALLPSRFHELREIFKLDPWN